MNKKNENKTICIKGFPPNYQEEELKKLCNKFGKINRVQILNTQTAKSTAIIEFGDPESAANSRKELHNIKVDDKSLLFVDYFESTGNNIQEQDDVIKFGNQRCLVKKKLIEKQNSAPNIQRNQQNQQQIIINSSVSSYSEEKQGAYGQQQLFQKAGILNGGNLTNNKINQQYQYQPSPAQQQQNQYDQQQYQLQQIQLVDQFQQYQQQFQNNNGNNAANYNQMVYNQINTNNYLGNNLIGQQQQQQQLQQQKQQVRSINNNYEIFRQVKDYEESNRKNSINNSNSNIISSNNNIRQNKQIFRQQQQQQQPLTITKLQQQQQQQQSQSLQHQQQSSSHISQPQLQPNQQQYQQQPNQIGQINQLNQLSQLSQMSQIHPTQINPITQIAQYAPIQNQVFYNNGMHTKIEYDTYCDPHINLDKQGYNGIQQQPQFQKITATIPQSNVIEQQKLEKQSVVQEHSQHLNKSFSQQEITQSFLHIKLHKALQALHKDHHHYMEHKKHWLYQYHKKHGDQHEDQDNIDSFIKIVLEKKEKKNKKSTHCSRSRSRSHSYRHSKESNPSKHATDIVNSEFIKCSDTNQIYNTRKQVQNQQFIPQQQQSSIQDPSQNQFIQKNLIDMQKTQSYIIPQQWNGEQFTFYNSPLLQNQYINAVQQIPYQNFIPIQTATIVAQGQPIQTINGITQYSDQIQQIQQCKVQNIQQQQLAQPQIIQDIPVKLTNQEVANVQNQAEDPQLQIDIHSNNNIIQANSNSIIQADTINIQNKQIVNPSLQNDQINSSIVQFNISQYINQPIIDDSKIQQISQQKSDNSSLQNQKQITIVNEDQSVKSINNQLSSGQSDINSNTKLNKQTKIKDGIGSSSQLQSSLSIQQELILPDNEPDPQYIELIKKNKKQLNMLLQKNKGDITCLTKNKNQ